MALVKIVNWEDGSNARYDISQMTPNGDGTYSTDGYTFDGEGRPLSGGVPGDGPGQWTDGLPGARGGTGPGGGGGDGFGTAGASNPFVGQLQSLLNSQSAADLSSTKAAIQQALISFGLVPEGFQDPLGAVDELTRKLAGQNTESGISTYARMLEQRQDGIRDAMRRLTGRGLRRSGARGYALRRNQLGFDRSFQDTLQSLLNATGSAYKSYASNEFQRQMQILQAMMNSRSMFAPTPAPTPSAPAPQAAPSPAAPSGPAPLPGYIESGAADYGISRPTTNTPLPGGNLRYF